MEKDASARVYARMPKRVVGKLLVDVHRGFINGQWRLLDAKEIKQLNETYEEFKFGLHHDDQGIAECIELVSDDDSCNSRDSIFLLGTESSRRAMLSHYGRAYSDMSAIAGLTVIFVILHIITGKILVSSFFQWRKELDLD